MRRSALEMTLHEDKRCPGVTDDVANALVRFVRADRDIRPTGLQDAENPDHRLERARRNEADGNLLPHAFFTGERRQASCSYGGAPHTAR